MDEASLEDIVAVALQRIRASLERGTPLMAERLLAWMGSLWPDHQLEEYWTYPTGFPLLLAPWWLEQTLCRKHDASFQLDLVYSSINLYYHIRLIDNLMDGDIPTDPVLLPALGFFHTEFHSSYHRYFDYEHPFWDYFRDVWFHSAEVTIRDADTSDFDLNQFQEIASQKTCAARIPLAAVCYKYSRTDLLPVWLHFLERYGWWSQMLNDTFDWLKDSKNNNGTFFLSEARGRKHPDESLIEWVIREGFEWSVELLETWMSDLKTLANDLENPAVLEHLSTREAAFTRRREDYSQGVLNLVKLHAVLQNHR
jgi:hypothetical protein